MSTNEIATTTHTIKTDIRFHELLLCSCIAPNQPFPKVAAAILGLTAVGAISMMFGGGVFGTTLFLMGCLLGVAIVAALHKSYQSNRLGYNALTVTVSPTGIIQRVEHSNSEARYEWSRVGSVHRIAGIVLMWIDVQTPAWICVPLRCFGTKDEGRKFYRECFDYWRAGQVKRHELGHKTHRKRARPILYATLALIVLICATAAVFMTTRNPQFSSICSMAIMLEALLLVPLIYKLDDGSKSLAQANQALIANDPKKALAICDKALERHRGNSRLYTIAGYSAYTLGEFDKGLNYCHAAMSVDPDDAMAYAGSAFGEREQGALQQAYDDICKAIELQPNIPWAYVIRANILSDWGRYEEALQQVDEAERWEGNGYSALHCRAGILCCMYQLAPALEFIAKAEQVCVETKRAPKEMAAVLGTKALIHSRAREFDVARAAVEAARQIDPYNPITAGIRAAIAVRCGDMPFAAQALAEAREMPLPARSLYSWYADMAIYQYKKGNVQEALQNADLGIATARRAMPLAVKGAILVREGNTEEALPLLEEAISLDPYFMLAYESRARVYDARGDKQRADEDRARYQPVGFESFF